jgi:hypothetical protein
MSLEVSQNFGKFENRPLGPEISLDTTPFPDISWVHVGMPLQTVLSGLADHFKLTKEDGDPKQNLEVWAVESLSHSSPSFWEIAFVDGKVGSIITHFSG